MSDTLIRRVLLFACALVVPSHAFAVPVTLSMVGTINYTGSPIQVPLLGVGDSFTARLTYESAAALSGPDPFVDTYDGAVIATEITVQTADGPLHYSASGSSSSTTMNFAAVRAGNVFFQITDNDQSGAIGSVQGAAFVANGVTYAPNFLALEIGGAFGEALNADALPVSPSTGAVYSQLTIGYAGRVRPNVIQGLNVHGQPVFASVPEPTTFAVLGVGLALAVGESARKRRATDQRAGRSKPQGC